MREHLGDATVVRKAGPRMMLESPLPEKTTTNESLSRRSSRTIPQVLKFLRKTSSKGGLAKRVSEKLDALEDLRRCVQEKGVEAVVVAGGLETLIQVLGQTNFVIGNVSGRGLEKVLAIVSELTLNCQGQERLRDCGGTGVLVNVADARNDADTLRWVVLTLRNLPPANLDRPAAVRLYAKALVDTRPDSIHKRYPDDASGRIAAAHGLMKLCPDYSSVVGQKFVVDALIGHLELPDCQAYKPRYSQLGDLVYKNKLDGRRMPEMSLTFMALYKLAEHGSLESVFLIGKIGIPTLAKMLKDLANPETRQALFDYGQFDLAGQLLELLFFVVSRSSNNDDDTSSSELRNRLDDEFRATKLLKKIEDDFIHDTHKFHLHTFAKHLRAEIKNERRCAGCGLLSRKPSSSDALTTRKKSTVKLRKCSRCLTRFYCSSDCQKNHYKEHRAECKALVKARDARQQF